MRRESDRGSVSGDCPTVETPLLKYRMDGLVRVTLIS